MLETWLANFLGGLLFVGITAAGLGGIGLLATLLSVLVITRGDAARIADMGFRARARSERVKQEQEEAKQRGMICVHPLPLHFTPKYQLRSQCSLFTRVRSFLWHQWRVPGLVLILYTIGWRLTQMHA